MDLTNQKDCLGKPINDIELSNEFKSLAKSLNYNTLNELLQEKASLLLKKPGFTFHLLQELIQFLEKRDLADLLKN